MFAISAISEAALLAVSLSLDAFTAGFAYGSKKIKIPMSSVQIINFTCCAVTGLALCLGAWLKPHMPPGLAVGIAFVVLFMIGLTKLLDSVTKALIRKHNGIDKQLAVSMFNIRFILNLYADPEEADVDASKTLSSLEAAALAFSLSLDGAAAGFGMALAHVHIPAVLLWSLVTNMVGIMLGCSLGHKAARALPFNMTWLGGAVLIMLAFWKLF